MKMLEGKRRVSSVGFIDPDKVHIDTLTTKPDETAGQHSKVSNGATFL